MLKDNEDDPNEGQNEFDKTEAYQQSMDLMFEIKMMLSKMCQSKKEENFFSLN